MFSVRAWMTMLGACVFGATAAYGVEYKQHTWDVGVAVNRYELKDNKNSLVGNSALFQVGRGWIGERWKFGATVDVIMGPYEDVREESIKTDFFGTGLTTSADYSIGGPMRRGKGSWGVSVGLNYSDIVGRSVESSKANSENEAITNLTMRASNFMVSAGIFRAWLNKARPLGNTPELLITRIEGYRIGINGAYPVQSSYSVRYDTRDADDNGKTTESKDRGSLEGYTILATFSAMLGH